METTSVVMKPNPIYILIFAVLLLFTLFYFSEETEESAYMQAVDIEFPENSTIYVPQEPPEGIFDSPNAILPSEQLSILSSDSDIYELPVSNINWNDGCTPTAFGILMYYYADNWNLPVVKQTVDDTISDSWHYTDYAMPIDDWSPIPIPDCSDNPFCGHEPRCIADFIKTSYSSQGMRYGSTTVDNFFGISNYLSYMNHPEDGIYFRLYRHNQQSIDSFIKSELIAGKPFIFCVDSDGDSVEDHSVFCYGYSYHEGKLYYSICTTWDTEPYIKINAKEMSNEKWGIYNVFGISFGTVTDPNNDGVCKFFDQDEDGVLDKDDNCLYTYNPNQQDDDNDGIGDACDSCVDKDNDGYCLDNDCNDNNPNINPGEIEVCGDNIDNNCNGLVDENCGDDDDDDDDDDGYVYCYKCNGGSQIKTKYPNNCPPGWQPYPCASPPQPTPAFTIISFLFAILVSLFIFKKVK